MNFLAEILAFCNWAPLKSIDARAHALWLWLMLMNNDKAIQVNGGWYWPVEFTVKNSALELILDFSREKKELAEVRNILIQMGRIRYKKGKGSSSGIYRMVPFNPKKYTTQTVTQTDTQTNIDRKSVV